jgi:hypothetical protein
MKVQEFISNSVILNVKTIKFSIWRTVIDLKKLTLFSIKNNRERITTGSAFGAKIAADC